MKPQGRSLQQIDPLTAGTSWDSSVFIAVVAWVYAIVASVATMRHLAVPLYMAFAVALITVALALHLWFAAPRHAPYRKSSYSLVVALTISAAVFQILAAGTLETTFLFEWGPIVTALVFASASGYRPLPDQYFAGLAAVLTIGGTLAWIGMQMEVPFGVAYFAVAGITLIAIVVLGQASYTMKAAGVLRAWNATVAEQPQSSGDSQRAVSAEVTEPFMAEVKHFYVSLLESGKVTSEDVERARQLSGEIRGELLTISTRTWVERIGCELHDPEHLLGHFDLPTQSSISALISGLRENGVRSIVVSLRSDPTSGRMSCVVLGKESTTQSGPSHRLRGKLAPYLRVMYVVFEDVRMIEQDGEVKVLFYYAS